MTDSDNDDISLSKTQLKQASEARQKIGEAIVGLSAAHLKTVPMDEELAEAVELARRINRKKDGYRRQLQFIGKLLRTRNIEPLEQALEKVRSRHAVQNAHFHQLEKWRDSIIAEGDEAIDSLMAEHPHLSRQSLRQYFRQAKKEAQKQAPPKASRALFQYLKSEIGDNE